MTDMKCSIYLVLIDVSCVFFSCKPSDSEEILLTRSTSLNLDGKDPLYQSSIKASYSKIDLENDVEGVGRVVDGHVCGFLELSMG